MSKRNLRFDELNENNALKIAKNLLETMEDVVNEEEEEEEAETEEDESDIESEVDESPMWSMQIESLQNFQINSIKFATYFSPQESDNCQIVVEVISTPGSNSSVFSWMSNPKEKKATFVVANKETCEIIDQWSMVVTPVAFAIGDLDISSKEHWRSTLQLQASKIKSSIV